MGIIINLVRRENIMANVERIREDIIDRLDIIDQS